MMHKMLIVGAVAIGGFILADYLQPKIATWLKVDATSSSVKLVKYGTVGGATMAVFYIVEEVLKVKAT